MLILFGFKGCGKTYYGRLLARRLGCDFIDTDDLISGDCRALAAEVGELEFRKQEKLAILSLNKTDAIIATGGGAVLDEENCAHLQKLGCLVYLESERIAMPIFEASFEKMVASRKARYESIEAARIVLKDKSEEEVLWELTHLAKSFR